MEKKKTPKEGTDLFLKIIQASVAGNPKPPTKEQKATRMLKIKAIEGLKGKRADKK